MAQKTQLVRLDNTRDAWNAYWTMSVKSEGQKPVALLTVFLISGGSGKTGQQVLRACTAQFPGADVSVVLHEAIQKIEDARRLGEQAAASQAIVCHTLVDPSVRQALVETCLALGISCIDMMGPTLAAIGERLSLEPLGQAGLLYELHREQFDRMDAVDFTMAHDDGQRLHELSLATVVLVGLSRVSKSVTCFYLATRGVRAANVPLVNGLPAPAELFAVEPTKVFGLTMNAAHLSSVRQARLQRIARGRSVEGYASIAELNREIRGAERLFKEQNWNVIDVSYKATEEVASEILDHLRRSEL